MAEIRRARRPQMRIILFEGPDKSGKSTLIGLVEEWLADELAKKGSKAHVYRFNLPFSYANEKDPADPHEYSHARLVAAFSSLQECNKILAVDDVMLIDRFHISESVFGYEYCREVNDDTIHTIDRWLARNGAVLVECRIDDVDSAVRKFSRGGFIDLVDEGAYRRLCNDFKDECSCSSIRNKIAYSYEDDPFSEFIKDLAAMIERV